MTHLIHPAAADGKPVKLRPVGRWLPIRPLAARHRPRILAHLLALDEHDRHLRFGYAASDAHIQRYVEQLDFDRDELFGIFNRRLRLVAVAHLAYLAPVEGRPTAAEFGVSVCPHLRGRRIGARLFDRVALHARNRGIDTLIVHSLSENAAMLRIAARAGARIQREGPDATACLKLPPDDLASHLGQLVESQAAHLDYGLKLQAHHLDGLVHSLRERIGGRHD